MIPQHTDCEEPGCGADAVFTVTPMIGHTVVRNGSRAPEVRRCAVHVETALVAGGDLPPHRADEVWWEIARVLDLNLVPSVWRGE